MRHLISDKVLPENDHHVPELGICQIVDGILSTSGGGGSRGESGGGGNDCVERGKSCRTSRCHSARLAPTLETD